MDTDKLTQIYNDNAKPGDRILKNLTKKHEKYVRK